MANCLCQYQPRSGHWRAIADCGLHWLKNPIKHFPQQVDGDLLKDGVCGVLITRKLSISQPTASEHLKILCQAGLIRPKRIAKWIFYKRDEVKIDHLKKMALAKL